MKTPRVHDFDPNAKVPELTSPLDGMPTIEKPQSPHTSPPVQPLPSSQAEPAAPPQLRQQKTGLPAKMQTRKHLNPQTSKPVNLQTGKPARIVKYSTYLTPTCKKGLQRTALETDRKDYEVLIEAVEQYLEKLK